MTALPFAVVRAQATVLGLTALAVIALPEALDGAGMRQLLADGVGDMTWLATSAALRTQPRALLADATHAVVVALPYQPTPPRPGRLQRARYAAGADYHRLLRARLARLGRALDARLPARAQWRAVVDSAPLNERTLAQQAGLGWIGRNALLLASDAGSYRVLGALLTTAALVAQHGGHGEDRCGSCHACETRCPTQALEGRRVHSERCISYLTIEHAGVIPRSYAERLEGWWFGCDLCQEVCPWNRFARPAGDARLIGRPGEDEEAALLAVTAATFDTAFAGRPIRRLGFARFRRNLVAALWSLGRAADAAALAHADPALALVQAQAAELGLATARAP